LAVCGSSSDEDTNYVEQPVEVSTTAPSITFGSRNTRPPPKGFEEVDRQHPYSVWATKAEIMAAFAYYQSNKYDEAIIALDRFIQLIPGTGTSPTPTT